MLNVWVANRLVTFSVSFYLKLQIMGFYTQVFSQYFSNKWSELAALGKINDYIKLPMTKSELSSENLNFISITIYLAPFEL